MNEQVVILAARRSPIGAFQGTLSPLTSPELGAAAAQAALADAQLGGDAVDEVVFGCVLPAGLGQAPARQVALAAGVATHVPATTVNKMCGSGMKALMFAADQIRAGDAAIALAGGIESMTNAPYLLLEARSGYRMGHSELIDHMFHDGLQSPWDGQAMGHFAEITAEKYGFTREAQDAFAERIRAPCPARGGRGRFRRRDGPGDRQDPQERADWSRRTRRRSRSRSRRSRRSSPPSSSDGTVTAASSSSISDGAAAIVLASASAARDARRKAARAHRGLRQPCTGAGVVHDRPGPGDPQGARSCRLASRATWTSTRSTRRSRSSPWPPCTTSDSTWPGSTSTAAPARSVTRSGRPARDSWSRCCTRCAARPAPRRRLQCIGGGEATAIAIELLD